MWQMVFAHISIEGWIIDPYVQSLFYYYLVQVLPPNNIEIVDGDTVTTDVAVAFSDILYVYIKLLVKIFSLGPDEDGRTCWKLVSLNKNSPVDKKIQ